MSIKKQLYIFSISILLLSLGFSIKFLSLYAEYRRQVQRASFANQVSNIAFNLLVVSESHLETKDERLVSEWTSTHQEISRLIENFNENSSLLRILQTDLEALERNFKMIQENNWVQSQLIEAGAPPDQIIVTREIEQRLAAQVRLVVQKIMSTSYRLNQEARDQEQVIFSTSVNLALAYSLALAVTFCLGVVLQGRRFIRRLDLLVRGAQAIRAGRFDHRIRVDTGDETGVLAQTLNHAAEELAQLFEFERSISSELRQEIHNRKQIEKRLRESEEQVRSLNQELERRVIERTDQLETSNKELESFAYSVSHDLRAPLRAIDGFSSILVKEYGPRLDDEARRLIGVIRTNTRKMDQLITDLLTISRVTRSEIRVMTIDMKSMAQSVYRELVAEEPAEKFTLSISDLPVVSGDPTLMRLVWWNLISNAIKFSAPKGEYQVTVSGFEKDGFCTYSVEDNGVGFNMKYVHKIFGVFQRLHGEKEFEGTGIGLAIVHRVIQRHGGQVWVESELGQGSVFHFSLPRSMPDSDNGL